MKIHYNRFAIHLFALVMSTMMSNELLLAQNLTVDVLVVSGGGSGGGNFGGGGGGGSVKYFTNQTVNSISTTVTVGAGGAADTLVHGHPGEPSYFGSLVADISTGGTGSGCGGGPGGSAGGAGGIFTATPSNGGVATSGLGNNGGKSANNTTYFRYVAGGGGGGAGGVGGNASSTSPGGNALGGNGGVGVSNSITGSAVYYGGGGGGGIASNGNAAGSGGNGGGGAGSKTGAATNGTPNTGGGGGGSASNGTYFSGAGGSGVVIVRYSGSPVATGGDITQVGGYTIHRFTSSGTFRLIEPNAGITNNSGTSILTCLAPSISLTATGGGTYSWTDGSSVVGTNSNLTVNAAGTYTVTVTGSNGATATASVTITYQQILAITGTNSVGSCSNNGSTVEVQVTGGTPPYSSAYSFAANGDCTYTVTDRMGCQASTVISR